MFPLHKPGVSEDSFIAMSSVCLFQAVDRSLAQMSLDKTDHLIRDSECLPILASFCTDTRRDATLFFGNRWARGGLHQKGAYH